jgi:hypothetical protein
MWSHDLQKVTAHDRDFQDFHQTADVGIHLDTTRFSTVAPAS